MSDLFCTNGQTRQLHTQTVWRDFRDGLGKKLKKKTTKMDNVPSLWRIWLRDYFVDWEARHSTKGGFNQ